MEWIQPLELQTWLISVFGGSADIFLAVALLAIGSLAGYFRMPLLIFGLMIGTFLLMFSTWISSPFLILIMLIGGLAVGFTLSKVANR